MGSQERIEQIITIALLAILAAGCLLVLRPFVSALLWALILSFSSWPLHAWLVRRLNGRRTIAATLMTLLIAAIFILPLVAVGTGLADSVTKVAAMVGTLLEHGPPGAPAWLADVPLVGPDLSARWLELERLGADWTAELQPYLETGRNWILSVGSGSGKPFSRSASAFWPPSSSSVTVPRVASASPRRSSGSWASGPRGCSRWPVGRSRASSMV